MNTLEDRIKWFAKRGIIKSLESAVSDEDKAVREYNTLADRLEANELRRESAKVRVIAAEEQIHKNDLKRILEVIRR